MKIDAQSARGVRRPGQLTLSFSCVTGLLTVLTWVFTSGALFSWRSRCLGLCSPRDAASGRCCTLSRGGGGLGAGERVLCGLAAQDAWAEYIHFKGPSCFHPIRGSWALQWVWNVKCFDSLCLRDENLILLVTVYTFFKLAHYCF